jgi:hypothetical protein
MPSTTTNAEEAPTDSPSNIEISQEMEDEAEDNDNMLTCKYYLADHLPTPTGTIAKLFAADSIDTQIKQANKLAKFLQGKNDNHADPDLLNINTNKTSFLVAVPDSIRKVRLIYGTGTGCGLYDIGENPMEDSILTLHGEYEHGAAFPSTLVLPLQTIHHQKIPYPTDDQIIAANSQKQKQFWYKKSQIAAIKCTTTPMVAFPCFLAYDAFEMDIDAMEIWERLQTLDEDTKDQFTYAIGPINRFLKATTTRVNVGEDTVQLKPSIFINGPNRTTTKWTKQRLNQLFPNLLQAPKTEETLVNNNQHQQQWTPATIAAMFQQFQSQNNHEEKKEEKEETTKDLTLGLSTSAYKKLLIMMGLSEQQTDEISILWTSMNEKNMQKYDKLALVRQTLNDNVFWKEAKVQPIHQHLLMVVQRSFEGDAAPSSSLTANAKGLTVFAFASLSDADVDTHNELAEALAAATTTTVKDITSIKTKATTPTSFEDLLKRIKRFGNFLYAIFGCSSPLFMQLEDVVGDLEEYQDMARSSMSRQTMASMLWIIHLQARRYSAGLMMGINALLPEFVTMCNHIKTKMPIQHGDVPQALIIPQYKPTGPSNPKKNNYDSNNTTNQENTNKKPKVEIEDKDHWKIIHHDKTYHPKIKAAMAPFLKWYKLPMIKQMCHVSRCSVNDLFPTRPNICLKSQLWGKCYNHCTFEHTLVDDKEATKVVTLLEKVIKDPKLAKVN